MPTPVVVVSDDVEIFDDVADAERYLEPWDLEEPLRVFDRNGRLLRASVKRRILGSGLVTLTEDPESPTYENDLAQALLRLLRAHEPEAVANHASLPLPELFDKALKYTS